ncbi:hypothetical protein Nepgr_032614 [Nepenthes gracilis]|uniref:Uncharacterized protein n=1 Tax=Nepenthes gracilis TaxID=150966 RepID=A0AAD3TKK4_NEPGR|nr:hypothetical protein Nepgr_032614 [Nepenthes gracilis]
MPAWSRQQLPSISANRNLHPSTNIAHGIFRPPRGLFSNTMLPSSASAGQNGQHGAASVRSWPRRHHEQHPSSSAGRISIQSKVPPAPYSAKSAKLNQNGIKSLPPKFNTIPAIKDYPKIMGVHKPESKATPGYHQTARPITFLTKDPKKDLAPQEGSKDHSKEESPPTFKNVRWLHMGAEAEQHHHRQQDSHSKYITGPSRPKKRTAGTKRFHSMD